MMGFAGRKAELPGAAEAMSALSLGIAGPEGGCTLRPATPEVMDTVRPARAVGGGQNRVASLPVGAAREGQGFLAFGIFVVWRA